MGVIKGTLGALIGAVAVWLGIYFIFHFDTWTVRLLSICTLAVCIYLLGKLLDKFFPM
ncbi:hypothetical protein RAVI111496_04050 [Rahnella victoriana]